MVTFTDAYNGSYKPEHDEPTDFRTPEYQEELNKISKSSKDVQYTSDLTPNYKSVAIVTPKGVSKDFHTDYSVDVDVKTLSQSSPFNFSPQVWKKINTRDTLFVIMKSTAGINKKLVMKLNDFIINMWRNDTHKRLEYKYITKGVMLVVNKEDTI